jgi:hypothetical protein
MRKINLWFTGKQLATDFEDATGAAWQGRACAYRGCWTSYMFEIGHEPTFLAIHNRVTRLYRKGGVTNGK